MRKIFNFCLLIIITFVLLSSCSGLIEFDIKRYVFGFIITLIIGVIGLILKAFDNNK